MFDIRASTLRVGDAVQGEAPKVITSPILAPIRTHRLALGLARKAFDTLDCLEEEDEDRDDKDLTSAESDRDRQSKEEA